MDRLDFSKDLNTFSYMYKNKNSDIFIINDESQKKNIPIKTLLFFIS